MTLLQQALNGLATTYIYPEDAGSVFLRNVNTHLPDYMVS
jgi:hypothetical protein